MLLCICYLFFDFYMWGWMSDVLFYVVLVEVGEVMVGGVVLWVEVL